MTVLDIYEGISGLHLSLYLKKHFFLWLRKKAILL